MEELKYYKENGYILYKKILPRELIEKINQDLKVIFGGNDAEIIELFKNNFEQFHCKAKQAQELISLYQLMSCKEIFNILIQLGIKTPVMNTKPLISFSCKSTAKENKYWKTEAHQDWVSTKGNGLTCWVPLINVNSDLGPLEIIPKSHKELKEHISKTQIKEELNQKDFISIPMEIGDALFFDYLTIHKSGLNKHLDKIRLSTHFRYDDISH